jgi:phosphoribosylanthranilate isomerase
VLIKICGLRTLQEALEAAAAGADLLGFVFAPSRRQVTPEVARAIIARLPAAVRKVGVFVDEEKEKVRAIADYCGLDVVQFHGHESPAYCRGFPQMVFKAIHLSPASSSGHFLDPLWVERLKEYPVAAFLLDTLVPGAAGGTGVPLDWDLAAELAARQPVFLAGGLRPENVGLAVRRVRPLGVDVSSGVETDGQKDPQKMQAFVKAVRRAAAEVFREEGAQ